MVMVMLDVDFDLLRKQKDELLKQVWKKDNDLLEGLINLIDDIQDQAVDKNGVAETEVFGANHGKN